MGFGSSVEDDSVRAILGYSSTQPFPHVLIRFHERQVRDRRRIVGQVEPSAGADLDRVAPCLRQKRRALISQARAFGAAADPVVYEGIAAREHDSLLHAGSSVRG